MNTDDDSMFEVRRGDENLGRYPLEILRECVSSGVIHGDDLSRRDGADEASWIPVAEISGITDALVPANQDGQKPAFSTPQEIFPGDAVKGGILGMVVEALPKPEESVGRHFNPRAVISTFLVAIGLLVIVFTYLTREPSPPGTDVGDPISETPKENRYDQAQAFFKKGKEDFEEAKGFWDDDEAAIALARNSFMQAWRLIHGEKVAYPDTGFEIDTASSGKLSDDLAVWIKKCDEELD